jgi:hypothetical protein
MVQYGIGGVYSNRFGIWTAAVTLTSIPSTMVVLITIQMFLGINQGGPLRPVCFVAAAGIDNQSAVKTYPAAFPGVLSVGTVDDAFNRAWFSNYGPGFWWPAPGVGVFTSDIPGFFNAYDLG